MVSVNEQVSVGAMDRELALSRMGGDIGLLREIAQLFLDDSPRMLADLDSAAASRDAHALNRAAHAIKGCVSNFGAHDAYRAALDLEHMGRSGDLSGLHPACQLLKSKVALLEAELHALSAES